MNALPDWLGEELRFFLVASWPIVVVPVLIDLPYITCCMIVAQSNLISQAAFSLVDTLLGLIYTFGMGMAMGIEGLFSQAFGAKNYRYLRLLLQRGLLILVFISLAMLPLNFTADRIFVLLGQNATVAAEAGKILMVMSPANIFVLANDIFTRFLMSQNIVIPVVTVAICNNVVSAVICYVTVIVLRLPRLGAISLLVFFVLGTVTMAIASSLVNKDTMAVYRVNADIFKNLWEIISMALGSVVSLMSISTSLTIGIILTGTFGMVELVTLSVSLQVIYINLNIIWGISEACCIRVGFLLSSRDGQTAKRALLFYQGISMTVAVVLGVLICSLHAVFARGFASDKPVENKLKFTFLYIGASLPVFAVDAVFNAAIRGCAKIALISITCLISLIIGTSLGLILLYFTRLGALSVVLGYQCSCVLNTMIFVPYAIFVLDWDKQSKLARHRTTNDLKVIQNGTGNGELHYIRIPPSIDSVSKSSLVSSYEYATLTCKASGIPKPTSLRSLTSLLPIKPDGTRDHTQLRVRPTRNNELAAKNPLVNVRYACYAENDYGKTVSKTVVVNEKYIGDFSPENLKVKPTLQVQEREMVELKCNPPDSFPKRAIISSLIIKGYGRFDARTVRAIIPDSRVMIGPSGNLYFSQVLPTDATKPNSDETYVCQYLHSALGVIKQGSPVTIKVRPNANVPHRPPTLIANSPAVVRALETETIDLYCISSANPIAIVSWRRVDGKRMPPTHSYSNGFDHLLLKNVAPSYAGEYECTVSNSMGSKTSRSRIEIMTLPKFIKKPVDSTYVIGDTAKFECVATGNPTPTTEWLENLVPVPPTNNDNKLTVTANTYELRNLTRGGEGASDMRVVQCRASNIHGSIIANGYINVVLPLEMQEPKPSNGASMMTFKFTDTVILPCKTQSDPARIPRIEWLYNGSPIIYIENQIWQDKSDNSLHINSWTYNTEEDLRGDYTCVARTTTPVQEVRGTYRLASESVIGKEVENSRKLRIPPSIDLVSGNCLIVEVSCHVKVQSKRFPKTQDPMDGQLR
ncbi:uncharacterized protein LOC141910332 [Tubulanus polymorphus]|uniref:uncharacterized protein LOC141910332 n=1 Tax=Tubulanus polymorphus TaxID=672921 RepID=UPI003DA60930